MFFKYLMFRSLIMIIYFQFDDKIMLRIPALAWGRSSRDRYPGPRSLRDPAQYILIIISGGVNCGRVVRMHLKKNDHFFFFLFCSSNNLIGKFKRWNYSMSKTISPRVPHDLVPKPKNIWRKKANKNSSKGAMTTMPPSQKATSAPIEY